LGLARSAFLVLSSRFRLVVGKERRLNRKRGAKGESELRRARLAASLRENLKRRKSQQRRRAEAGPRADDKAQASCDPAR